jgi:hypothetical protein
MLWVRTTGSRGNLGPALIGIEHEGHIITYGMANETHASGILFRRETTDFHFQRAIALFQIERGLACQVSGRSWSR